MGTALKTLSLRLRGAKVELEEAGLETDSMAESTSTLQAKLEALTHGKVDIMINADTFKSTTQILREMSQAWEDMTDIERAAALELMGGKRQSNILSSLISNFETVEDVIETSMDSSGSAMAENAKWMDSIEGKSQQLTNAMQALWNETLNSDVIKFFLDTAIGATELVDAIGVLPSVLAGVITYMAAFKGITPVSLFNDLATNVKSYAAAMQQVQQIKSLNLNMTSSGMLGIQSVNAYAQALSGLSAKQQAAILSSAGLEKAHIAQVLAQNGVEDATIRQIVGLNNLNAAKQASVAMTGAEIQATLAKQGVTLSDATTTWLADNATKELTKDEVLKAAAMLMSKGATEQEIVALLGLAGASGTAAGGIKGVTAALGSMMTSNPIGMIMMIVSGITMLTSKAKQAKEEISQAAEQTVNAYDEAQKTLRDQKKTIDELSVSYERLSKGVDLDTNDNISLTTASYKEYLNICNDIADMYPELVTGYDAQGNAILSAKGKVDVLTQAYKDNAKAAYESAIAGQGDVWKDFENAVGSNVWSGKSDELRKKDAAELLTKYINGTYNEAIDGAINAGGSMQTLLAEIGLEPKWSWKNLGSEDFTVFLDRVVKESLPEIQALINDTTRSYNAQVKPVLSILDAYLRADEEGYGQLSKEYQKIISGIVNSFNTDDLRQFDSITDIEAHLDSLIEKMKDPAISEFIAELSKVQVEFSEGNISYGTYKEQLDSSLEQLKTRVSENELEEIKVSIGIDDESLEVDSNHIKTLLNNTVTDVESKINSLSVEDLQIAGQLEVPEGVLYSWDELTAEIEKAKIAATQDFDLSDYKTAINSVTESISSYQEAIQKLDKGSFTLGDFMELIEEMPELAKGVDISSKSFSGLRSNLQQAIKTSTKSFVRDLKELKYRLEQTGKSTESIDQLIDAMNNMSDDALDNLIDKYGTLADAIDEARTAQEKLSESMGEEETGYETRGEAMEYMKGKMKEGKIGSESNLWNVAKQYGFTFDSSKTINENADALAKYIAVRERWFKEADDGDDRTDDGYAFEGIENFIQDVETATEKSEELQKYLSWTYDDSTGTLNFDFDNENLDTIIQSLSKTEQFAGLTKEEFIDMIRWVGQYFNINWGDNDDILNYLDGVATSAKDAKTKVEEYGVAMQKYLGGDTTVDLTTQTTADLQVHKSKDGKKAIVVTPVLENGEELTQKELDGYVKDLLAGKEIDPDVNIKLAEFDGEDAEKQAEDYKKTVSAALGQYNQLRDTLSINTTLDSEGIEGLKKIKELQETITTNSDGATVINQEAFTKALKDAGYAEDQIEVIIGKIKELNSESLNSDLFKIDETLVDKGVAGLKEIESLQSAIKESSSGWTVVDTDMFASVLQDAGYTKTQIDELIKKIQEYESVVLTSGNTDPLGLDATNMSIDTLKASLDTLGVKFSEQYGKLGDGLKDIKIDVPDLVTMLNEKGWSEEAIRNYCAKLSQTNLEGFQIKVDQKEIDAAIEKANEVPAEKPINVEITGTALTDAQNINSELNKMQDRTVEVTINETTVKKTEEDDGFNLFKPTTWFANGTAHAPGTAFADGNWGLQQNEHSALVGELGPELVWNIAR